MSAKMKLLVYKGGVTEGGGARNEHVTRKTTVKYDKLTAVSNVT
jgi:hypothetical protein